MKGRESIAGVVLAFSAVVLLCRLGGTADAEKGAGMEGVPDWARDIVSEQQVEAAKKHGVPVAFRNSLGMSFVLIPPGEFMMGSKLSPEEIERRWGGYRRWYEAEHPRHKVRITKPFYMGVHEITRGQYNGFVWETDYETDLTEIGGALAWHNDEYKWVGGVSWRNPSFEQTDDHPVACVSWRDVMAFVKWLRDKENRPYRLPTEAEWEYACRAGSDGVWWWGDDESGAQGRANVLDSKSWTKEGLIFFKGVKDEYKFTAPVGSFQPNPWGLYDMIGNIREWCSDWHDPKYYSRSPSADPKGADNGMERVRRGGVCWDPPYNARAAFRDRETVDSDDASNGFRLALSCEGE